MFYYYLYILFITLYYILSFHRINLLIGDSTLVLPTIKDTFDLIHIDGGHITYVAEKDIINSMALCNDNCILIMDDTNMDNFKKNHIYRINHDLCKLLREKKN